MDDVYDRNAAAGNVPDDATSATPATGATGTKPGAGTTNAQDPKRKRYDGEPMWYSESQPQLKTGTKNGIKSVWYVITRTYEDGSTITFTSNAQGLDQPTQPGEDRSAPRYVDFARDEEGKLVPDGPAKPTEMEMYKKYKDESAKYEREQKAAKAAETAAAKLDASERAAADKAARTPPAQRTNPITGDLEEWRPGVGLPGDPGSEPSWQVIQRKGEDDAAPKTITDKAGNIRQYNPETKKWEVAVSAEMSPQEIAKFEWEKSRDIIRDDLAAGRLSFDQARAKATDRFNEIRLQLDAEQNRLTQRGQDVTQRGQDIDAAVALGREASQAQMASLAYLAPKGSRAQLAKLQNAALASSGATMRVDENPTSSGLPFDPTTIATSIANRVLANVSPAAQAAGATPTSGFQLPRAIAPVAAPMSASTGFYLPGNPAQAAPVAAPVAPPAAPAAAPQLTAEQLAQAEMERRRRLAALIPPPSGGYAPGT